MPLNATYSAASIRGYFAEGRDFWIPTQIVTASDGGVDDFFGASLAMDNNALYMAVAATGDNTSGDQGSVYIYHKGSGSWVEEQKLTSPVTGLNFGVGELSINANGDYLAVPNQALNVVYIYVRSGSTWTLQATLTGSDTVSGDAFGVATSFSSSGDFIIIGARNADLTLPTRTNAGAAYVFTRSGSTWTQQAKLVASDAEANDNFGSAVVINANGTFVAVGAPNEDTGGSNAGAMYLYTRSGSTWTQNSKRQSSDIAASDNFGDSLSISDDGLYLLVGAPGDDSARGSVYVFSNVVPFYPEVAKIVPNAQIAGLRFGTFIDINFDGTKSIIGAQSGSADLQSVYLFERVSSTWTQTLQFQVSGQSESFGGAPPGPAIAISSSTPVFVVIGDFRVDAGAGALSGIVNSFDL